MSKYKKPTLMIDIEEFQHYLDALDGADEEKQQLFDTLWSVICEFVFFGFNVTSIQQMQEISGQDVLSASEMTQSDSPTVESEDKSLVDKFVKAYDGAKGEKEDA